MQSNYPFTENQKEILGMFHLSNCFSDALDLQRSLFDDRQITFMETYVETANKLKNLYHDIDPEFFA